MASDYTVTGQHYGKEREPDGSYAETVTVDFETKADPPVKGSVTVPRSLLADHADYLAKVRAAIAEAVAGHNAVANL